MALGWAGNGACWRQQRNGRHGKTAANESLTPPLLITNACITDSMFDEWGNRGCVMFGISPPAHNNIMLATATHCCLF